jgi:hypothetical protein
MPPHSIPNRQRITFNIFLLSICFTHVIWVSNQNLRNLNTPTRSRFLPYNFKCISFPTFLLEKKHCVCVFSTENLKLHLRDHRSTSRITSWTLLAFWVIFLPLFYRAPSSAKQWPPNISCHLREYIVNHYGEQQRTNDTFLGGTIIHLIAFWYRAPHPHLYWSPKKENPLSS